MLEVRKKPRSKAVKQKINACRSRSTYKQRWGTVYCGYNILAIYCNICNIYCILLPEANIAIYTACLRRILRHCHIFYSEATIYCYMEFSTISGKQNFFFFFIIFLDLDQFPISQIHPFSLQYVRLG